MNIPQDKKLAALKAMMQKRALQGKATQSSAAVDTHIPLVDRAQPLPLSFSQQRLWFIEQLDPNAESAYHINGVVHLTGALNIAALTQALNSIVERHEVLRTCFPAEQEQPEQKVAQPSIGMPFEHFSLNDSSAIDDKVNEWLQQPFCLASGRLVRTALFELAPTEFVLALSMHHAIADGWSLGLLLKELSELYQAYCANQSTPLSPLTCQYADYAAWQRDWLNSAAAERQSAYWQSCLAGAPELLSLPTDFPRPEKQSYVGDKVKIEFDAELSAQIHHFSQRHGMTDYMVMLAAWSSLLARFSGQDDIVIGSPVANRSQRETEVMIGFFANTLALRVDTSGQPSVAEFLARVKQQNIQAQSHQDLPFDHVVEKLKPNRSLSYTPIFQVMFAWQDSSADQLQLGDVSAQVMDIESEVQAQFDLSLSLGWSGANIEGDIRYPTSLFKRSTIEQYLNCWRQLLGQWIANDQQSIDQVTLLDDTHYQQVTRDFNGDKQSYPVTECIHQRFEAMAQRYPNNVAVSFEQQTLSYRVLNEQANQLAHWLRAQGVGPDSRVAIALQRSETLLVAILATLKAGGAYVPLDPNYPQERLQYSLQDSQPQVVITTSELTDKLGQLPVGATFALCDKPQWLQESTSNLAPEELGLTPHNMAYIIYTSGSTGKPKGVMVEHHNVLRLLAATEEEFGFNHRDVWTLFHSYAFDFSVWEIWGALLFGGRLVVVPHLVSRQPDAFYQLLCEEQVTVLNQTPSAFRQLVVAQTELKHQLRYVIFGGEALELSALAPWYQRAMNSNTQLINMYGITETTVHTTYYPLSAQDVTRTGASPIGVGLRDLNLYILDQYRQPVPVGVTGELYVSGAGVARGYLNRADLTAERFMLDPFVADGSTRMYKSGDLGRWLDDGSIEYLGRNDDQVKIRGFRIELGEIEACIRSFTGVIDAAVIAAQNATGEQQIVAYYVGDVALDALRDHVADLVPNYMIPAAWMALHALPLTSNGKLDRRALPQVDQSAMVRHEYEAPVGEKEQLLARLWSELLNVEQVGRQDHFFELGGHSLLAVQLTSRVRAQSEWELSLADLFAHPVLADLALMCTEQNERATIVPRANQAEAPLSLAQQRLWFLAQMDRQASAAYTISSGVVIEGELNIAALQQALNSLYVRHSVLRSQFIDRDGIPYQVVDDLKVSFPFNVVEGDSPFTPQFDLATGEVVAAQLNRINEGYAQLRIAMHHIVTDGWSIATFIKELGRAYAALVQHQPVQLDPLSISYGDFAAWQQEFLVGERLDKQQAYWLDQLKSMPHFLHLPTDYARPAKQDFSGASLAVDIDADLTRQLNQLSQEHGCTLYMTLLASWSALMSRLAHQEQVIIGSPIAGRTLAETENLLGMFVNTQPMCANVDAHITTSELLSQIKQTALDAQANQDLPFERMVEAVSPERNQSHSPIYQVMFALQNMPSETITLDGLRLSMLNETVTTAQCDLSLLVSENNVRIVGQLNYATALFDQATIERMVGYWRALLRGMVQSAQQPIHAIPILSASEFEQVIVEHNQTKVDFGRDVSITQRFENWAQETPDAIAIVQGEQRLTYQMLNVRANRLADELIQQGVQYGSAVAICIERSIELIIAELAIVKCGAIYVPLDPKAPQDRLNYIVQDSQAMALIMADEAQPMVFDCALPRINVIQAIEKASGHSLASANPNINVRGDSAAYIMYTSGSTGQPKGVVIAHRGVARLISHNGYLEFSRYDRASFAANPAFDATTLEVWGPLLNGAAVVVISDQLLLEPTKLADELVEQGVTILWLTIGLFNQYSDLLGKAFSQVRYLMIGGDVVEPRTVQKVLQNTPPKHLLSCYGPTETTTFAMTHEVMRVDDVERAIPLGKPIGNTQIYVLDEHHNPVPMGVTGEIVIGGEGVALEYLGREDLTAERFLPNPFSSEPGARMYCSGDLGRRLPDGTIEFLGRNDFQVKIRGYRIELGEIETALQALPAINDAVVIAKGDSAENKRLIAYYTLAPHNDITVADLKSTLSQQFPPYMVPGAFVVIDSIPLTPNGKVDRRALPNPDESAISTREYVAPQGAFEQQLAQIWAQLLDVEQVGRDDHFFELGGHSLLAVQLISRIKEKQAITLTITDLFDHPTLKALAARMAYVKLAAFKKHDLASAAQKLFKGKVNG
ncbi:amino acid adenylation domain-containing protein [Vibrio sp. CAIM 722]|uniref:Amino acid adenylation domain-containing protein n=1 Tax=Vibrio eleionomae TaxID=2653505 RepID=A0A7X4RWP4_9VIBR|nr:non-ribosomal peptide synthetase [Vibrio eleionomae]MZI95888.1 amino acid adenylation domain-containing protein [Vibrio eleionomae]